MSLPTLPIGGRTSYVVMECPRDGCGEPVSIPPNCVLFLPGEKPPWCHEVVDLTPGQPRRVIRKGSERC